MKKTKPTTGQYPTFKNVLILARKRIALRKDFYICFAIARVLQNRRNFVGTSKVMRELLITDYRNRISDQLRGYSVYEGWLNKFHNKTYREMCHLESVDRSPFIEGRLQWIDDMISKEKR